MGLSIDIITQQWQKLDPRVGLVMPGYTFDALDYLCTKDFRDKVVFEWGGGCSTFWWSRVCKHVYVTDVNQEWMDWIVATALAHGFDNVIVECRWLDPIDKYIEVPCTPDIVCIDGSERTACLERALMLSRPLTIIFDNWQQDGVYLDERAEKFMEPYRPYGRFFIQKDHTAHEGRPWQTAIWELP